MFWCLITIRSIYAAPLTLNTTALGRTPYPPSPPPSPHDNRNVRALVHDWVREPPFTPSDRLQIIDMILSVTDTIRYDPRGGNAPFEPMERTTGTSSSGQSGLDFYLMGLYQRSRQPSIREEEAPLTNFEAVEALLQVLSRATGRYLLYPAWIDVLVWREEVEIRLGVGEIQRKA